VISEFKPPKMVDLEQIKQDIATLADKVKTLKGAAPVDKDAIGAAVKELLDAKKLYADNNDGIGVDGKPFETGKGDKKASPAGASVKQVSLICCNSIFSREERVYTMIIIAVY
jgi:hypothetical protein